MSFGDVDIHGRFNTINQRIYMHHQGFKDLGLSSGILSILEKKGFLAPTPIQSLVIPALLSQEEDLIGKAQTGTGKTAAFGLPIIDRIHARNKKIQALILTPTRELAMQVCQELISLKGDKPINIVCVYGGQSMPLQIQSLKKIPNIVVGTPGRVIDHIQRKTIDLSALEYFVVDEADEMLNVGFIDDVEWILSQANPERKTLFFSATMPAPVVDLAKKHMKKYLILHAKEQKNTVPLTKQIYFEVPGVKKQEALHRLLQITEDFYGFIFCRTRNDVDHITNHLQKDGHNAEGLHGNLSQAQRERVLKKFRKKECTILVGTDIAARGIDIKGLTHVINYSLPDSMDAYVHRIGRTGRAGQSGEAMTLVAPSERRKFERMRKVLRLDIALHKIPTEASIAKVKEKRLSSYLKDFMQHQQRFQHREHLAKLLLKEYEPTALVSMMSELLLKNL